MPANLFDTFYLLRTKQSIWFEKVVYNLRKGSDVTVDRYLDIHNVSQSNMISEVEA